ncbi:unnamed protein product [Rotaria socialis]|uniref:Potassium channel domain-containing protein n=1 Tax=Rotaria socialis TaxID=392032 RepID=A0A817VM60_9BILA|nr:unnamed protein product [Rotaria socialis]CAF3345574.1 unnamed protein product [Rotaria socialis]CAF3461624.1 unnamed protein product [Rotaria socialis]CAF3466682.1 unnamed protein product [Rotaria socialis]CAF3580260.1 unnamed protein product [Rotaria socialis]
MLTHHDKSMGIDNLHRSDISIIHEDDDDDDNKHQNTQANGEIEELETSRTRRLIKKVANFLVSHIGLVGLVVVYAVAGGFLFELLEQHQEKLNCQEAFGEHTVQLTKLKQQLVAYIQYNVSSFSSTSTTLTYSLERDNTTVAYTKIGLMLYNYRDFVITTGAKYRYYGDDCSVINKWTYPNALLFAITIITTIGYGNVTPVTWEGQICCICYATIGIPIFLLCVANISGVLGEMFRLLYSKVICRPCYMIKRRRANARKAKLEEENGMHKDHEIAASWKVQDNSNNTTNTLAKIANRVLPESEQDEEESSQNQRVAVPLTITMLIIAFYIWAGSLIFHAFEQWSMIQAGYFCFITLATIGFGDFVPGQRKDDPKASLKLIVGAIYVLFGMAILAMCFDLMQEEIVAKFRWIGRKIGIIEKEKVIMMNQQSQPLQYNRPLSGTSSITDFSSTMNSTGKIIDDDNENGFQTRRSSSGARKFSPRNNIARVHPVTVSSNEGTLHQRAPIAKAN